MLDNLIQDITRRQRPYYLPQGTPIKGLDNQTWLIFQHRDGDNLLKSVVAFLGLNKGKKDASHRLIRIDPNQAKIHTYSPQKSGNIPPFASLRTSPLPTIEQFLTHDGSYVEQTLLQNSLREVPVGRRYSLPTELDSYNVTLTAILERTAIYRRSTGYFNSGVLKLYEEPLTKIVEMDGRIQLLLDWCGFTSSRDIEALEKLFSHNDLQLSAQKSLEKLLKKLSEKSFSSTQLMAELVRLGFLQIKLIKMDDTRAIYHKKTGIFSDSLDHHVLHEGSDNFTSAAHSKNAESVTFFSSWESAKDKAVIEASIQEFDAEWSKEDIAFDLSQEFLQQVLKERDRRAQKNQPRIDSITPNTLKPGEKTGVKIKGENLGKVDKINVPGNELVDVEIVDRTPQEITAKVTLDPTHPPQFIFDFRAHIGSGTYNVQPKQPVTVQPTLEIPEFSEIEGFKRAVELILAGKHGTPDDFLYWTAQQRPQQFRVERSALLDDFVDRGILFEHQKSGAQHCLRVMEDFGVAVCADAVGLGKTRLAAAVARLYREQKPEAKIAVIAAKKLLSNWEREMAELGLKRTDEDYDPYNKNLMSRKGGSFLEGLKRYGGPDLIIIDEAHEGIRNYKSRIHKLCQELQALDRVKGRQRHYLLLTATPWNNRREDIYNILQPFITRPQGFTDWQFPSQVTTWFQDREIGVENFTDETSIFRKVYKQIFLQRTRQALREAMPELNVYARRQAEWLAVEFEPATEKALEQIFTEFETSLYIPFADPIRYFKDSVEKRSLLQNQRRFFLQRAESSMYALQRTIVNFRIKIEQMQSTLVDCGDSSEGLEQFLLLHYKFQKATDTLLELEDTEAWDEDYEEEDEDEAENDNYKEEKRQQLRKSIELAITELRRSDSKAQKVYQTMMAACQNDLQQLQSIQKLLAEEFVKDHKREQVTRKVEELVAQGQKVLLISTFSDTVLDYYYHMSRNDGIAQAGLGMATGATKRYHSGDKTHPVKVAPHNIHKGKFPRTNLKRLELFRLFAPAATCRDVADRPAPKDQIQVLIGSETLSVGQNLQDADYLINIDLPWNPMMLEQRIGRIDRPKQHKVDTLHIYYANSESQLLRQASRLANLNKKLVGDLATEEGTIDRVVDISALGASIYGDTLFDVGFLQSLVKARKMTQENLQENQYSQQETSRDLYTQQELLFSEDVTQRIREIGEDYQANPIALGRGCDIPVGLLALTVQYFGPNGEPIPDRQELIFWNDQTGERDGYGQAIAIAAKTPVVATTFGSDRILDCAEQVYAQATSIKQQREHLLERPDSLESVKVTSERLNKIQQVIRQLDALPEGIDRKSVKQALETLSQWKDKGKVKRLLKEYTDGEKSKLAPDVLLVNLLEETQNLNLLLSELIQPTSVRVSVAAMLLRPKTIPEQEA
jgi:superfamily II DNA or RNA helicase